MNAQVIGMGRSPRRIVIVGGGFTGYAAAIALIRRLGALDLTIMDAGGSRGAGLAYGAAIASNLLNIRVKELTLSFENSDTFSDWLAARGEPAEPDAFVPRPLVAEFVRDVFQDALKQYPDCRIRQVNALAEKIDLATGNTEFLVQAGSMGFRADDVFLATGYGPEHKPRFGLAPFGTWPELRVRTARKVIIAGSGLTMLDVLQRLDHFGFEGAVSIISRHGLPPNVHTDLASGPVDEFLTGHETPLDALRKVRARLADAGDTEWQAVINAVRPKVQSLWAGWDSRQRASFQRHLRSYWDKARHRASPESADVLERYRRERRVSLSCGRVLEATTNVTGWDVWVAREPGSRPGRETTDLVIDCTGHAPAATTGLLAPIISRGLLSTEQCGRQPVVNAAGQALSPSGKPLPGLYLLGPAGMGSLFEVTAMAEILAQADLAAASVRARAEPA